MPTPDFTKPKMFIRLFNIRCHVYNIRGCNRYNNVEITKPQRSRNEQIGNNYKKITSDYLGLYSNHSKGDSDM